MLRKAILVVSIFLFGAVGASWAAGSGDFPGRALYREVPVIEVDELYKKLGDVVVVDVRSNYEYETLHIKGAVNLPLADMRFAKEVKRLRADSKKPIVLYCNGRTCLKSYKAARKAMQAGVKDIYAFDAGIMDWTKAHPDQAVLLGKNPVNPASLISKERLDEHTLEPGAFADRLNKADIILLDIRDAFQRESLPLFPSKRQTVSLDNKALKTYVDQAKRENKTLLVYDAVGKQVQWLQYFLEQEGVSSYYFMRGGAEGFYEAMIQ